MQTEDLLTFGHHLFSCSYSIYIHGKQETCFPCSPSHGARRTMQHLRAAHYRAQKYKGGTREHARESYFMALSCFFCDIPPVYDVSVAAHKR